VSAHAPADRERPASVSFIAATEILMPPREGLEHLRGDEANAQLLTGGDLLVRDGRIAGAQADPDAELVVDASGMTILPGLVDCHTHLPFAGWRASEYEHKVRGVPYEEISRAGGGIASSARALRESSDAATLSQSRALAREMLEHGTTAFECKSGYGLSQEGELRALALAAELDVPQATTATALLAHAVPPGHTAGTWMEEVEAMLPAVKALGHVTALDIFVESIAFGNEDLVRMGELARSAGLHLRCHAEQLSTMRSVPVAIEAGARSVDHLSRIHPDDIGAFGSAQCAAVLLPGAEFLGAEERAPARALLDAGAILALATDLNPGTSPVLSLPLVIGLAARLYGLSTLEALAATTLNAAWVQGLHRELGSIEPGKRGDLVLLDTPAQQIAYRFGRNPVAAVFIDGRPVHVRPDAQWRLRRR
jgi:imidazolonepropionase